MLHRTCTPGEIIAIDGPARIVVHRLRRGRVVLSIDSQARVRFERLHDDDRASMEADDGRPPAAPRS